MRKELTDKDNVNKYWELGGKLDRDGVEEANTVRLKLVNKKIPKRGSYVAQVSGMEAFSKVSITSDQKFLYTALREVTRNSDSLPEVPGTQSPNGLTDQRLLAEVLLLTGDMVGYESFKRAYPNIFSDDKEVKL